MRAFTLAAGLLAPVAALAQPPATTSRPPAAWQRVVRTHLSNVVAVALLPNGGAVVAGTMPGGDVDGEGQPRNQRVVTKWSASGQLLWSQRMDFARQLAVVGPHVYVVGYRSWGMYPPPYFPQLPIGDTAIVSRARREGTVGFIVKLLDLGSRNRVVWVKQVAERNYTPLTLNTLVAQGGNLYVGGNFHNGPLHLDALTLTDDEQRGKHSDPNSYEGFVAKLVDEGRSARFAWTEVIDGEEGDNGSCEQVQSLQVQDSAVYVAGTFTGRWLAIGRWRTAKPEQPARWRGYPDESLAHTFVAKLLDRGTRSHLAWARLLAGPNEPTALAVSGPHVYLAGRLRAACIFDSLPPVGPWAGRDSAALFLARLRDLGSAARFAWVGHAGDSGVYELNTLAAQGAALYLGGRFPTALAGAFAPGSSPRVACLAKLLDASPAWHMAWAQPADSAGGVEAVAAVALQGPTLLAGGGNRLAWCPLAGAAPVGAPAPAAAPRKPWWRRRAR